MENCNPVQTPVNAAGKLSSDACNLIDNPSTYRSLVGVLQYLTFTKTDISYVVQQVCMHMYAPKNAHWDALKRIIHYVKGTVHMGLHMSTSSPTNLVSHQCRLDRLPRHQALHFWLLRLFRDNLVSWSSKRQTTISRSSTEAEYRGVANVVARICWLCNLLLEIGMPPKRTSLVYCDNVSALYLSQNPIQHQRTKHI